MVGWVVVVKLVVSIIGCWSGDSTIRNGNMRMFQYLLVEEVTFIGVG